jgi:hypothetical protein
MSSSLACLLGAARQLSLLSIAKLNFALVFPATNAHETEQARPTNASSGSALPSVFTIWQTFLLGSVS